MICQSRKASWREPGLKYWANIGPILHQKNTVNYELIKTVEKNLNTVEMLR